MPPRLTRIHLAAAYIRQSEEQRTFLRCLSLLLTGHLCFQRVLTQEEEYPACQRQSVPHRLRAKKYQLRGAKALCPLSQYDAFHLKNGGYGDGFAGLIRNQHRPKIKKYAQGFTIERTSLLLKFRLRTSRLQQLLSDMDHQPHRDLHCPARAGAFHSR